MNHKLVKIGEAAELLGVSIDSLRRWDKSGEFPSIRLGSSGHRFYQFSDIEMRLNSFRNQRNIAKQWAESLTPFALDSSIHCETRDVFQARLEMLQTKLKAKFSLESLSLAVAVAGEIGNNSFDHNLGNWVDVMGVFFYYDEKEKTIILADRGQGVLSTLKRVKSDLNNAKEALEVAFTLSISGRKSEVRGNGLKFVKSVITEYPFSLNFQSGDAFLYLKQYDEDVFIQQASTTIRGCFATIRIEE